MTSNDNKEKLRHGFCRSTCLEWRHWHKHSTIAFICSLICAFRAARILCGADSTKRWVKNNPQRIWFTFAQWRRQAAAAASLSFHHVPKTVTVEQWLYRKMCGASGLKKKGFRRAKALQSIMRPAEAAKTGCKKTQNDFQYGKEHNIYTFTNWFKILGWSKLPVMKLMK